MDFAEYERMYDLETFYWWFVARRKVLADVIKAASEDYKLKPSILDVGCGTGSNHSVLEQYGEVFGIDFSPVALEFSRKRGITKLQVCNVESISFPDNSFDILTALDVLEHTDNDLSAMKEMWRVAKPGATVFITVPAYGFLWSEHDEALHHRRRYTANELRNKLTNSGFQIVRCSYFISALFFPILAVRIFQNLLKHSITPQSSHVILPKWANSLLVRILDVERLLLRYVNLPFGVSLVCIARKSEPREARELSASSGEKSLRVAAISAPSPSDQVHAMHSRS